MIGQVSKSFYNYIKDDTKISLLLDAYHKKKTFVSCSSLLKQFQKCEVLHGMNPESNSDADG